MAAIVEVVVFVAAVVITSLSVISWRAVSVAICTVVVDVGVLVVV